ncbi:hypothetical protein K438DRAFT_1623328, partial [Mycena galopus ATCC 62051]
IFIFVQGTLAPILKTPLMTIPSAVTLSADPRNIVYFIFGRDGKFLEQHLGHLKRVRGARRVYARTGEEWSNLTEKLDFSWMGEVKEVFRYYGGAFVCLVVEMKSPITWHYRASDPK